MLKGQASLLVVCLGAGLLVLGLCAFSTSGIWTPVDEGAMAYVWGGACANGCQEYLGICTSAPNECSAVSSDQCAGVDKVGTAAVDQNCTGDPCNECALTEGPLCYTQRNCEWNAKYGYCGYGDPYYTYANTCSSS